VREPLQRVYVRLAETTELLAGGMPLDAALGITVGARNRLSRLSVQSSTLLACSFTFLVSTMVVTMTRPIFGHSVLRASSSRAVSTRCLAQVRSLATPSSSSSDFSKKLNDGPSLDDFVADNVEESSRVVFGNTSSYVALVL
jgi:hypothetical protein